MCVTCDSALACLSCPATEEVIGVTCDCNSAKGMIRNTTSGLCVSCSATYANCATCIANASVAGGVSCGVCAAGYYVSSNVCELSVCGDGWIDPSEQCDDGNFISGDGCFNCLVEGGYQCFLEPSVCLYISAFSIKFSSLVVSTSVCNEFTINFLINPIDSSFDSVPSYKF